MNNIIKKHVVMVVEDNDLISKVYQAKFAKEGFEVSLAYDGEEAIRKITDEKPDIILLDLMIPKKDGFGVLEDIKKIPNLAKIPVIVLSNLGQQKDKERALFLGANEYLIKVDTSIQSIIDKTRGYISK